MPPTSTRLTVIASLVVVVLLIAAGVTLTLAHVDQAAVAGLLTLVMAVAAPVLVNIGHNATQSATLDKIDHQTNGVLDARIEGAVNRALNNPIGYAPTEPDER